MPERLALNGGPRVFTGRWPEWPQAGPRTLARVREVLDGGRWAVSGPWTGRPPLDVELASSFAEFVEVDWCVPVDHGSSALLASLHGLGIGPGDEVVVPGLTWIAPATAVIRAGAVPVLVDVEPDTLCLAPAAVEAAVGPATAAIVAVHLYCAMADMDALRRIADRRGLALIEDAAQAHGARWRDRRAGALGDAGVFSMQQGKTLTAGEGGAVVTGDAALKERIEILRSDGRRYTRAARCGLPDLEEVGVPTGWNMDLSEVQAALVLDGLERLPAQNERRARAGAWLDRELSAIGLEPIRPHPQNVERAYYHYAARMEAGDFGGRSIEEICQAVGAELGAWVHPPYAPLTRHRLYQPHRGHPLARMEGMAARLDPSRFELPEAERQATRTLLFHHSMLLGESTHLEAIAAAVAKVRARAGDIEAA